MKSSYNVAYNLSIKCEARSETNSRKLQSVRVRLSAIISPWLLQNKCLSRLKPQLWWLSGRPRRLGPTVIIRWTHSVDNAATIIVMFIGRCIRIDFDLWDYLVENTHKCGEKQRENKEKKRNLFIWEKCSINKIVFRSTPQSEKLPCAYQWFCWEKLILISTDSLIIKLNWLLFCYRKHLQYCMTRS